MLQTSNSREQIRLNLGGGDACWVNNDLDFDILEDLFLFEDKNFNQFF